MRIIFYCGCDKTLFARGMALCKSDQLLWLQLFLHFFNRLSSNFHNILLTKSLRPFISLINSYGNNSSFILQPIFIKLLGYCCHYMTRTIFYCGLDWTFFAKVTALGKSCNRNSCFSFNQFISNDIVVTS